MSAHTLANLCNKYHMHYFEGEAEDPQFLQLSTLILAEVGYLGFPQPPPTEGESVYPTPHPGEERYALPMYRRLSRFIPPGAHEAMLARDANGMFRISIEPWWRAAIRSIDWGDVVFYSTAVVTGLVLVEYARPCC